MDRGVILAFGLISPAFLSVGAGLVAVPILIHVLNRRRFRIVDWAAMDFLLKAMKKNRRRLRFEQMLLLATRCLILLALGFALSRPLGCSDTSLAGLADGRTGTHVFIIDNSLSMAYVADRPGARTHLDQAKIIAKALIDRLSSGGEAVAIVTTARPASAVIAAPAFDLQSAENAIDRIPQSYCDPDMAGALTLARDIARAQRNQPNTSLTLLDDSTRVEWETSPEAIRQIARDLPPLFKAGITHYDLSKPGQWNHAVVSLDTSEKLLTNWFPADFLADVRGFGPCPSDPVLTWKIDDLPFGAPATIKAGPQSTPVANTATGLSGGIHVVTASLNADDHLAVDNTRWRVVDVVNQMKVLIVEGQRGVGGLGSSGAFLDTALNPPSSDDKHRSYVATERISDLELGNKILADYRCVCLCGVGQIQDTQAENLEKFVRQGGTLMIFMGDPVTSENYNATLYKHHLLPGPLTRRVSIGAEGQPRRFAFNPRGILHPLLADFANQQNTGMEAAEIFSYWQVDISPSAGVERVLDFQPPADSPNSPPDPAITIQSVGAGRVLFCATSADPESEWTTFMAHQAYPALMHMLLLGSVSSGDSWMNLTVGQSVSIPPAITLASAPSMRDASHIEIPLETSIDSQGRAIYHSQPLQRPGLYWLSTGAETYKIAVNVPPAASDIRTIDDVAVKKALGDVDVHLLGDTVSTDVAAAPQGKELGWGIMLLVAGLLACESFMAMKFGHRWRK